MDLGLSCLGMKAIRVLLECSRIFFFLKFFLNSNLTNSPTAIQNLWKNPAWRPSGPRALNALIVFKAKRISASVGSAAKFCAFDFDKQFPQIGIWLGAFWHITYLVLYSLSNPLVKISFTLSMFTSQVPSPFVIRVIWLLLLQMKVERWKKVVFLSPWINQLVLNLIPQSSSSRDIIFSSSSNNHECKLIGLSTLVSLATRFFFFENMFPNSSIFHVLAFQVKVLIALLMLCRFPSHASLTIEGKFSWLSHLGWKRKGLSPKTLGGLSKDRSNGSDRSWFT